MLEQKLCRNLIEFVTFSSAFSVCADTFWHKFKPHMVLALLHFMNSEIPRDNFMKNVYSDSILNEPTGWLQGPSHEVLHYEKLQQQYTKQCLRDISKWISQVTNLLVQMNQTLSTLGKYWSDLFDSAIYRGRKNYFLRICSLASLREYI